MFLLKTHDAPLWPSFVVKSKRATNVNATWKLRQIMAHQFFKRKAAVAATATW